LLPHWAFFLIQIIIVQSYRRGRAPVNSARP
jgi:hypothetical protein